ncbi:MAG: hypothetical protein IPP77_05530 [Bacteroidetes bacterium]|nr:hypothetical protein [Bacteroidota bacterium]
MTRLQYFVITFFSVSIGLMVGSFVYELFDANFSDIPAIIHLLWKSSVKGVIVGLILGLLNAYFRINFGNKNKG